MRREYIIAFSSFYKAIYAQEKLAETGKKFTIKKLPPEIMKTCGYALYVQVGDIREILTVLDNYEISTRGVYTAEVEKGKIVYKRLK